MSINLELPKTESLKTLAPEKDSGTITQAMGQMQERIIEAKEERRRFAPAGQSTQVIVGADDASDTMVLQASATLYGDYGLRRVYYSAFSPIPDASSLLAAKPPPLQRENRLYQADWLLRYYGFSVDEIAAGGESGMLDLEIDPKLAWALKHRDRFPVDVNMAPRELLLRVPGLGARVVDKILETRRHTRLRLGDVARLSPGTRRAMPFLIAADHSPARLTDRADLRARLTKPKQMSLFG
jgi:predicted DNA-binding helix-hairpin-helix protein